MAEREVEAARRIARFLDDEFVKEAFARLEKRAYGDFRAAETPEAREKAWMASHALEELQRELRIIVDHGEFRGAIQ
jgi:hypothetical protein